MKRVLLILALYGVASATHAGTIEEMRQAHKLPDYSNGETGILGPFIWSRAADMGEDARFSDATGSPRRGGDYLWLHQFMRHRLGDVMPQLIHGRNNLVSISPATAYRVQPVHFLHNTSGAHNSKVIFGYMEKEARFQNADNADLAHLAGGDRVVLFLPVRHGGRPADPLDQSNYFISPIYGAQSISIIQFAAGEMIDYAWFKDPKNLDPHILFDLVPYFEGEHKTSPGIAQPIFDFQITGIGGWHLRVKRDGRGIEPGSEVQWDLEFTHESPGAKPYTVNVTPENSTWALSTFSPGGNPADTSEILLRLHPIDRGTGAAAEWPSRAQRLRHVKLEELEKQLSR